MRYDPDVGPDAQTWLAVSDDERLEAVRRHHRRDRLQSGNQEVHAIIHVTVETQLAQDHPEATAALVRLLQEGLDRHEALHAIGSVLAEELFDVMKSKRPHDAAAYAGKLRSLTASSWRTKHRE
jgi:hypothetical protein